MRTVPAPAPRTLLGRQEPFEHAEQLASKREELQALTAELRLEAQSEAAKAAAAAVSSGRFQ